MFRKLSFQIDCTSENHLRKAMRWDFADGLAVLMGNHYLLFEDW